MSIPPAGPSVLVLCGQAPRHLYLANHLCRAHRVLAVVHETGRQWSAKKVRRALRPRELVLRLRRLWRARDAGRAADEARFFFGDASCRLADPSRRLDVPHVNHPRALEIVDRLDPDVIAVFGTSLIRPPLLGRGRIAMLNLHGGLSPRYRGSDGVFWALYHGEPAEAGCTLHHINAGIDTGAIVAHVRPAVHAGDDERTIFWRSVVESAPVYAEAITRLGRGIELGQVQTEKGRLFRARDRTPEREAELAERLAGGLLAGVDLPVRVSWFGPGAAR